MTSDLAIHTERLTKRFGSRPAVDALSIEVPRGVTAGFIGPNGAGKTTTMGMLLGLIEPTEGSGHVLGQPIASPEAYLRDVGALIEHPAFYGGLTGAENLAVLAAAGGYDEAQIPRVLERVGLGGRGDDRYRSYSMGMKQRLGIASALLGDPPLLVLDEPTNGLDPAGIREIRQLIGRLADDGRSVFVSSHVLAELEQVCDWFVMIERGSVLFQGAADDLRARRPATLVAAPECAADVPRLHALLEARGYAVRSADAALALDLGGSDAREAAAGVSRLAMAEGVTLVELSVHRQNLEEQYLGMLVDSDGASGDAAREVEIGVPA